MPGILPERLSQEQAEQAATAVTKLGVSAAAIPAADIPNFGEIIEVAENSTILDAARSAGIEIRDPVTQTDFRGGNGYQACENGCQSSSNVSATA